MAVFQVHNLSPKRFTRTVYWAIGISLCVVISIATLARAAHNFQAALTEKPDVAIYLLLPEMNLGQTTVLKESETERDYLAETASGSLFVKLQKLDGEWKVAKIEPLHR